MTKMIIFIVGLTANLSVMSYVEVFV